MLSKLPPREKQIVDILYERGPLAVAVPLAQKACRHFAGKSGCAWASPALF